MTTSLSQENAGVPINAMRTLTKLTGRPGRPGDKETLFSPSRLAAVIIPARRVPRSVIRLCTLLQNGGTKLMRRFGTEVSGGRVHLVVEWTRDPSSLLVGFLGFKHDSGTPIMHDTRRRGHFLAVDHYFRCLWTGLQAVSCLVGWYLQIRLAIGSQHSLPKASFWEGWCG